MTTPRAQWKAALVEKAMQFPELEKVLKHNRSSDFEKWQRVLLFAAFKKYPSLSDERWAELTAEVELTKDQVINWFYSRKSDDAKKKMEEVVSTVNFREFQLKGPPPTEKEKKEVAAKHAKIKNRVQFVFNPSQVEILNEFFKKNATPVKKDMEQLREKLGDVEHKQIKQWFANKRKRSKEYQEHYHQGESVDKNPTQRHSCSAFPVQVRNILLEEFEKCSNVNEKNMERIMKDTGMSKTQVQSWFWNERERRKRTPTVKDKATTSTPFKKSAEKTKKIQITIELDEDDKGNVAINIPANLFEKGAKFTIQRKPPQSTARHAHAKIRKVQVTTEVEDSDDEEVDHSGSSGVVKKPIGVSKRKNGKSRKPEKSLPSTTRPTRKRAHVPSETEETDDKEEDKKPAPVFRKWNEVSKKPNETSEKSQEKATDTTSENEETDDEEESGPQHAYPTRSKRQATSETPKPKTRDRKDRKSDKKLEQSRQVSSRNVYPTRSKANVSTEIPEELDTSDVASPNSSFRTIRRSRRNQRPKTSDQSETGHFDEFNSLSPTPSRSPAPQRQEREDSNTPSEGIAMAPEPMDFDDFDHHPASPEPKPQNTKREDTAPAEMDLSDSSRETTPAAEVEQAPQPPTEEAPPTVAPEAKVEEKKNDDCEAGGSGIDWEGERLARRQARRRLRQIASTPDESDLSESSRSSTPLSGTSERFTLEEIEAIEAKLNSNESFSTEQSIDGDDESTIQGRSSDEEMEDGSDEEMEVGSDGEMEDGSDEEMEVGSDGEMEDGSDGEMEVMEQNYSGNEDEEKDDKSEEQLRIERQVNEYLEKNARVYENSFRNFSHK